MKLRFLSNFAFLALFSIGSTVCNAQTPDRGSIYVSSVVTAKEVQGDTLTPVGITATFPTSQNIFHTVVTLDNAPENTKVKTVWLNAEGKNLGEFELTSEGTRNLDFTFKPLAGSLPAGDYGVDIYVNGVYDSTLRFSVSDNAPQASTSSSVITGITMALNATGDEKTPQNTTNIFQPTNTIHAIVAIVNAPANTQFKASWYLVKSDSGEIAPNTLIDTTQVTTEGTRNIDFTLTPTAELPAGEYKVELWVNGVLDPKQATFTVKP